jgi:hypothetical protein
MNDLATISADEIVHRLQHHPIAALVPCYNEEMTIGAVVQSFRKARPHANVYDYDNNSADRTVANALEAGAIIGHETHQGKGHVVRRMFADIDADVYILVDGDNTYDAAAAPRLAWHLLQDRLDLVNASRASPGGDGYPTGHRLGNQLLSGMVARVFGKQFGDMLSGYKVFSRRFVKSFPALSAGFEIETELIVHALELQMPGDEWATAYGARPEGSVSKLRTWHDGIRILSTICLLVKEERPFGFFSSAALALTATAIGLAWPLLVTYLHTGLVPRLPTAVLSTGLTLLAFLSFSCGLILDTVTRGRREMRRLHYLSQPGPSLHAGGNHNPFRARP